MKTWGVLTAAILLPEICLASPVPTQSTSAAPPVACSAPIHRAFDFWVGLWEVSSPQGVFQGINRIEPIQGGCALKEDWSGVQGDFTGHALNLVGPDGRWHQTRIDSSGHAWFLSGGPSGLGSSAVMILEGGGPQAAQEAEPERQRITWTPMPGGVVRQVSERSRDGGKTWTMVFDGRHRKVVEVSVTGVGSPTRLSQLTGDWVGTGEIQAASVLVELSVQSLFGGRAFALQWVNLGTHATGRFEGRAIYSHASDGTWSGRWWDSQGGQHALVVSEAAAALDVRWGERGRTVYSLTDPDTVEVVDSFRDATGVFRDFGRSTLHRKPQAKR